MLLPWLGVSLSKYTTKAKMKSLGILFSSRSLLLEPKGLCTERELPLVTLRSVVCKKLRYFSSSIFNQIPVSSGSFCIAVMQKEKDVSLQCWLYYVLFLCLCLCDGREENAQPKRNNIRDTLP